MDKYIPNNLDSFYENEEVIKLLKNIFSKKNNYFPNLLLYGECGTGKTSMLNIIKKELNNYKVVKINLLEDFKKNNLPILINTLKTPVKKIISIDNCLKLKLDHQNIIKSLIKKYNNHNVFIVCLNDKSNINDQFNNMFITINFKVVSKNSKMLYLQNIIEKENIKVNSKIINHICDISNNFKELINNTFLLLSYYKTDIDIEDIFDTSEKLLSFKIIKLCDKKKMKEVFKLINKLIEKGYSEYNILSMLIAYIELYDDIDYEKKINYIKSITFTQLKIFTQNKTYPQLISLIARLCLY